jgi:hypothetical protein
VHCRLTTSDLRQLRSFFIAKGSRLLSHNEQRLRARKSDMVAGFESGTAIIKGQRFPYVRCTDVMAELKAHVDAFAAAGMLQQRADITGSELRVTLMGDKGGDFTKLLLSIWDVTDSLSPLNCVFLGFYKGAEDYDAIAEVFGPILRQLGSLPPIHWMPSTPVLLAAGPPPGATGPLSSAPAPRWFPASAVGGPQQSAAAPRPPNHAARRRARVMARQSASMGPMTNPPDAAARARLTALRRPLEQKAAEVKQKATEQRAQRMLAEDCLTSKQLHRASRWQGVMMAQLTYLPDRDLCAVELRGGTLFEPFGSTPSIISPDCRRCSRLVRAGALKAPSHTFVPYERIRVLYSGDMSWLSKLLGTLG